MTMGDPAPAPDNNEHQSPPSPAASAQPSMTVHPITISGVPMHMYPCSRGPTSTPPTRTKRRQVKNACTNCQKACKKCDDARPCLRCVTYGLQDECVDSQRKERQKGIKRGPYKKRDGRREDFYIRARTIYINYFSCWAQYPLQVTRSISSR